MSDKPSHTFHIPTESMAIEMWRGVYISHAGRIHLKARDSVNEAHRKRDEKRIWHLQRQVLRELPGSEVQTQVGRHIKVSESQVARMSRLSPHNTPLLLPLRLPLLRTQHWLPWELAWPYCSSSGPHIQTASVPSHSTLSALYMEHRGRDCPLCRPQMRQPDAPQSWFLTSRVPTLRLWVHCTWAGESQTVPLSPACALQGWMAEGSRAGPLTLCSQRESEQVQHSGLRDPAVMGSSEAERGPSVCQLATSPLTAGCPLAPRGGGSRVCVFVCVCLCVCYWKRGLGNWEWEPPDCNSGCYLGNPGGKDVLNEWVGEGSTVDACVRGTWLCFMNLVI